MQNIQNIQNMQQLANINPELIKIVIQCLSNCEEITKFFKDPSKYNEYTSYPDIFPITSNCAKLIFKAFSDPLNNKKFFVDNLKKEMEKKFNLASNDIKNIFTFLIENIHEEIKTPIQQNNNFDLNQINKQDRASIYKFFLNNKFKPENTTIIANNFFGINEAYIQCPNCRIFIFNYNIFKLIEFTIEEVYPNILNKVRMLIENGRNKSYLITMNNLHKKIISLDFFFEYYRDYNHIKDFS